MVLMTPFLFLVFFYSLVSRRLEQTVLTAPILFTPAGAFIGSSPEVRNALAINRKGVLLVVIARLGGDSPGLLSSDARILERLLGAVHVDRDQLAAAFDEVCSSDPMVRDAIKESLAQFYPTIQVDRDRFPALDTARSRFVLCTRRMYEAHREDVFEGYYHLETDNPFNVLFSQHEEGLPFIALTYMPRIHEDYLAQIESGRAALGHPTADLAATLPLLDA